MLFELHDMIPYLFSISIFASFAYAACFFRGRSDEVGVWLSGSRQLGLLGMSPVAVSMREPLGLQLIRSVRRKESPDGGSADCRSLSMIDLSSDREDKYDKEQTIFQKLQALYGSGNFAAPERMRYERHH